MTASRNALPQFVETSVGPRADVGCRRRRGDAAAASAPAVDQPCRLAGTSRRRGRLHGSRVALARRSSCRR